MELESANPNTAKSHRTKSAASRGHRRYRNFCIAAAATIIFLVLLIVILAFTVFKPKKPITVINDVSVQDLDFSADVLRLKVSLNVSLLVDLTVENPNKVSVRYKDSTALLNYRGKLVGEAPIPAGGISSGETKPMNMTLVLMADQFFSESSAYSDVLARQLPLNTYMEMKGKVKIMNLFKIHFDSSSSCNFTLFLSNRTVGNQLCHYNTKL